MAYPPSVKARARYLRSAKRQSFNEIIKELGVAKGTLSLWLEDLPLRPFEIKDRRSRRLRGNKLSYKHRGEQSKHHATTAAGGLTSEQRSRIAEAAVLFRLALHGIETYGRVFDGQPSDWVALSNKGRAIRIQVRWAAVGKAGLPYASLRRSEGRYRIDGFDFLVVYSLYTDTAYVMSYKELAGFSHSVSVRPTAAEAFWKLKRIK